MKFSFKPFDDFVKNYTTENSRKRYADSEIQHIDLQNNYIIAKVKESRTYTVEVFYSKTKVSGAQCTCEYDYGGFCKHIVHVLIHADNLIINKTDTNKLPPQENDIPPDFLMKERNQFTLSEKSIFDISEDKLSTISHPLPKKEYWNTKLEIIQADFEINELTAQVTKGGYYPQKVRIQQTEKDIRLECNCGNSTHKLCTHLHFAVKETLRNGLLQLPFNPAERHKLLAQKASEKGWSQIANLDKFFNITLSYGRVYADPKIKLLPYTDKNKRELKQNLLSTFSLPQGEKNNTKDFLVIETSEQRSNLACALKQAPLTKSGDIKAPIEEVNLHHKLRNVQNMDEIRFYLALMATNHANANIEDYREIVKNPSNLDTYLFSKEWHSEKAVPKKLFPIEMRASIPEIEINVKESGDFYLLTCGVKVDQQKIKTKEIKCYRSLFIAKNTLYCLNNEAEIKVLDFFKQHEHQIYLQREQFTSFKTEFLDKLENAISVSYSFIKPAPKALILKKNLNVASKYSVYLSELDEFVMITPALSYGETEVSVLSKQTPYTSKPDGTMYYIERNDDLEHQFIRNIQTQHHSFDKLPQTDFFYLHKKQFLDEGWFIKAFEAWRSLGYTILGFNKLKNNRYNEHSINVRASVQSGIDWFDIHTEVSYGNQKVSLKQLQKSILNKTRFVELGDGTQGILPQEWIDKFSNYFRAGELRDDTIRTHKSNFQLIDDMFEQEILSKEVKLEIQQFKDKLNNFHSISQVKIPKKLRATLRDYQKEGLNWLNFLDGFGFGGCLADDMGLGKTVQIIAYFLTQHEKKNKQTNLVIVPTSLLFNWQRELDKFAPHLKYAALYGVKRKTEKINISHYDIILTTYGTLLTDIALLKKEVFNVIVLDESQAIKNPDSKRYKAVRLLHGRQRVVLTGTPIENNTFDLFAQLSFAIPGLLGTAKRFSDDYSTPIDKFQDTKRAQELQRKIHPFVLRRTKLQVAKELPEKTEIVIHCEMGTDQRRVYDTYKNEFQKYLTGLDEDELHSSSLHILQGLTKMRQICNSPALLGDNEYYGDQSAKLEELLKQIDKLKDNHKVLVFSQFVGMLDLVKQRLDEQHVKYAYLTGKTRNREEQVAIFQEDEKVRVFLISLKAGGTGLNLTQADYVFLIDPWWNPATENQAIDRAYRIGQQNKVVAVRFITPDSI